LQHDLDSTAAQLNKHLEKLGAKIIEDETERYHTTLELLRKQAETTINSAQSDVSQHQTEIQQHLTEYQAKLEAELSEKMNAEHDRLTQQIDTKLADAVTSFLLETLQHNVDLGAQGSYLTAMLEEHKDELTKGMKNDA
jgi:F0F1-type ATP synthase membrane subunit b/b'